MTLLPNNNSWILPAPAKVNLHLWVTDILPDGRHALDTSFAFVDVADQLHVHRSTRLEVSCSSPHLSGPSNLVYRVLESLQKKYHVQDGLSIHIEKKIPEQAGLGGGSSDAATALLAASTIWGLNLSLQTLIDFATPWGADIPCFLFGRSSLASGVGEKLTVNPQPLHKAAVLLARPAEGLSTKAVFDHFDAHAALTMQQTLATMRAASQSASSIGQNMLEASAVSLLPELDPLLTQMRSDVRKAWMSGSGSCCISLCDSMAEAEQLAEAVSRDHLASWTHVGHLLTEHPLPQHYRLVDKDD